MKATYVLVFFIILLNLKVHAKRDTLIINNTMFLFEVEKKLIPEEGSSIEILRVFRIENDQKKYLLKHILFEDHHDCNSEAMELGHFEIKDSTVIFYTHWSKGGDAPAYPCGVRKQIYRVDFTGKLLFEKSWAYIEPGSLEVGAQDYHANLLELKDADELIKEVHLIFNDELKKFTDNWIQIGSSFGYCVY